MDVLFAQFYVRNIGTSVTTYKLTNKKIKYKSLYAPIFSIMDILFAQFYERNIGTSVTTYKLTNKNKYKRYRCVRLIYKKYYLYLRN